MNWDRGRGRRATRLLARESRERRQRRGSGVNAVRGRGREKEREDTASESAAWLRRAATCSPKLGRRHSLEAPTATMSLAEGLG